MLLENLKLVWNVRVSDSVIVEIDDADTHTVFDFIFTEIVQLRTPLRILFQIIGDMFRKKDVTGIAAIHHPLRDVDSGAGDVGLFVQVGNFVDRPTVNSHSNAKLGMTLQRLADFQRA